MTVSGVMAEKPAWGAANFAGPALRAAARYRHWGDGLGLRIRSVDGTILFAQQIAWIIADKPI